MFSPHLTPPRSFSPLYPPNLIFSVINKSQNANQTSKQQHQKIFFLSDKVKSFPWRLLCVGFGTGPALKCGLYLVRFCLNQQTHQYLSVADNFLIRDGTPYPLPPLRAGTPFGLNMWGSRACCHGLWVPPFCVWGMVFPWTHPSPLGS